MTSTESLFRHRSETPEQRLRRLVFPPTSPFQFTDPSQPQPSIAPPGYAGYAGYPPNPYATAAAATPYSTATAAPATTPAAPYNPFHPPPSALSPEDLFFLYKAGRRHRRSEDPDEAWQRAAAAYRAQARAHERGWWARLMAAENERHLSEGRMQGWMGGAAWAQQVLGALLAGGGHGGRGRGAGGGGPDGGRGRRVMFDDEGLGRGRRPRRGGPGDEDDGEDGDEDEDEDEEGEMDALFRAARQRGARNPMCGPPHGRRQRRDPGDLDMDDDLDVDRGRRRRGAGPAPRGPSFSRRRRSPAAGDRPRPAFGRRRDDDDEMDLDDEWERITPGMFGAGMERQRPLRRPMGERRDDGQQGRPGRDGWPQGDFGNLSDDIDFGQFGLGMGRERRRPSVVPCDSGEKDGTLSLDVT